MYLESAASASIAGLQAHATDIAILLGNEVDGISSELLDKVDAILEIPMYGAKESFNVSVATGIALYALRNKNEPK